MIRQTLVTVSLAAIAQLLVADETVAPSYRELRFGAATITDAKAIMPTLSCGPWEKLGTGIVSCGTRETCSIGDTPVKQYLYFDKDKLFSVNLVFSSDRFDFMESVFEERYGKPRSREISDIKTKAGASFANTETTWAVGDVEVTMERFSNDIRESTVEFLDVHGRDLFHALYEREKKKAATSF